MSAPRGFSLIEVTVSIFIMSVMLLMLQSIIRSNVLVQTSKNQSIALSIARNKIEGLRIGGYAALPASGSFSDSLVSTLPLAATTTLTVTTYNARTKLVSTSVLWRDRGSTSSSTVSLSILLTETGGLP